jgi:hypothetical protein
MGNSVKSLGALKYVGSNLLISKYNNKYYDFSQIKILGKIREYND